MIKSRLRVVLAEREITLKELHEITGIQAKTLTKIKTGRIERYPMHALDAICRVLGCQPGDLLQYIPDEKTE